MVKRREDGSEKTSIVAEQSHLQLYLQMEKSFQTGPLWISDREEVEEGLIRKEVEEGLIREEVEGGLINEAT